MINHDLAQGILDFFNELGREYFQCLEVDSLAAVFDCIVPKTIDYIHKTTNTVNVTGSDVFESLYLLLEMLSDDIKFVDIIEFKKAAKGDDLEQLKLLALTLYQLAIIDCNMVSKISESLSHESVGKVVELINFLENPCNWPQDKQWSFILMSKERQSVLPSDIDKENFQLPRNSLCQTPMGWRKPSQPNSILTSKSRTRSMYTFTPSTNFNSSFVNSPIMSAVCSPSFEAKRELRRLKNSYNKILRDFEELERSNVRMRETFNTMKKSLSDKVTNLECQLDNKNSECIMLMEQLDSQLISTSEAENLQESNKKLLTTITSLKSDIARLTSINVENTKKCLSLEKDVKFKEERINLLEKDLSEKDDYLMSILDKHTSETNEAELEKQRLQEKLNLFAERNEELTRDRFRLKEDLIEERNNAHEQQHVIHNHYQEKILELKREVDSLLRHRETLLNQNETFKISLLGAKEAQKQLEDEVISIKETLNSKEEVVKTTVQREESLKNLNNRLTLKIKRLETDMETVKKTCQDEVKKYSELIERQSLFTSNDVINEQNEQIEKLKEEVECLKEENERKAREIDELKEDMRALEEERKSWEMFKNSDKNFFLFEDSFSNTELLSNCPNDFNFDSESLVMFANSITEGGGDDTSSYDAEIELEEYTFTTIADGITRVCRVVKDTFDMNEDDESEYQTADQFLRDSRNSCYGSSCLESIAEESSELTSFNVITYTSRQMAYNRPRNGAKPDHFLEQQNNELTESLANKAKALKRITIAISDDVREQNRLLNDMDDDFLKSNSLLGITMKKLGIVSKSGVTCYFFFIMDSVIALLPSWMTCFSTHMDFHGQQKAERIYEVVIVTSAVVGFLIGFFTQQISHMVISIGIGFVLSCIIILPPWPCFRRHPVQWLPNVEPPKKEEENDDEQKDEADKKND
ncbi:Target SNARE coiled-coil domain and Microsomal signal peptidase 12kDa subunit family-containing protein [Strongyloides ratti]|uniref:Signal peptidase complex subunit 1 n=1 Tax=Strongyloides ratti TaxID=34506 RepID=A0A090LHJ1_STRRB|nr:Target SNARE coiled-coil domain and Microsomal signal peptidase 12kDa subunit family-containing protein [Strongyloides ratti]CEF67623.1 Target SNARE coiled-coil domain and Microsomal signal peptidase 12kDa subunit family-containing protein [Strongyloides ratti]